ncbi:MAG TPA: LysE family translocator [Casimicrobiaceae bacterium]|jgi:threonine/homoserine/homoserine lactone efflux protein
MSFYGLLSFCVAYVLAVASPGPGVAAVLARSLGHGMRGAPAFIAGFLVGDLVWFAFAAAGLAALAQVAHTAFLVVRYAGVLYLLYLAYRLWTAPALPLDGAVIAPSQPNSRLFFGTLALTLGNPKTMLFFLALLPIVVPLDVLGPADYLEIVAAIVVILPLVLGAYALAATQARQFFRRPRSVRLMNRCAGTAMAGAAIVIATRDT